MEYFNTPISKTEVLDIAKNHPWEEQLYIKGANYNPSLDFTSLKNGRSFCLTAHFNIKEAITYLQYFVDENYLEIEKLYR